MARALGLALLAPALAWSQTAPALAQTESKQAESKQAAPKSAETKATPAAAKNDPRTLDTVVVTGVRESLRSAQALKQDATQIIDSVQAEDIGKLPDANTVEALQRITGVQIQRRYGEGATDYDHRTQPAITVRGLTQVRNFLDGRDTFSASGGRSLDLEAVPPELLAGVDVYKNPPADIVEGGIGGVVNLRTRLPFDAPDRVISATAKGNYYDLAGKYGGSLSGLYSDRFDTSLGEIGLLFNLSNARSSYQQDGFLPGDFGPVAPGAIAGAPNNAQIPFGFEVYDDTGDRKRVGAAAALQWKASDSVLVTAQVLHNKYGFYREGKYFYENNRRKVTAPLPGARFTFNGEGYATSGALTDQVFESARFDQDLNSANTNSTLNVKWKVNEKLTANFDAQYLSSYYDVDRNGFVISLYDNEGENGATAANRSIVDFDLRGARPRFEVRNPALLNNPNNYGFTYIVDSMDRNDSDQFALRTDLDYVIEDGFFTRLSGGVRYADTRVDLRGFWHSTCLNNLGPDPTCTTKVSHVKVSSHPELARPGPTTRNFFGGGTLEGGFFYPEFSPGGGLYDRTVRTEALFGFGPQIGFAPNNLNSQSETTWSGYLNADYASQIGSVPIDGNIGVRLVQTRTGSDGALFLSDGSIAPYSFDRSYRYALPSLNLRARLSDELQLRLAYSQSIARPNFDQLSTNVSLGAVTKVDPLTGRPSGGSGNPELNPIESDNFDATLEWYFAPTGSLTLGAFYKRVDGFLASGKVVRRFNGVDYDISTTVNSGKGFVRGIELGYQQFYDFLPGWLNGLGFQFNYTYVDSSVSNPFATAGSSIPSMVPLEKLSKHSYNAVPLYEKGPLTARLAWNWRSKYLDTTYGSGANGIPQYQKAYASLDASVSYDVNENLALSVDAVNLTNRMNMTYIGTPGAPLQYQLNDRRFGLSVRMTY